MAPTATIRRLANTLSRQPEWIVALAISLAVFWLHFFFLYHDGGFWRDEVNLINLAGRHSVSEMLKDSFPLLMPLLVSGWTGVGLGHDDLSLRLLGTLIGLSLPAALWYATWKIKRSPPLPGLLLLALNSTVIMFGDSLRAYGLGSLTILLAVTAACLFLKNPNWRRTGWLAAMAVLSVQSLYQNALLIAAICFGAWAVCWRQKNWGAAIKIFVVAGTSAASLLPYWSHIVSMPNAAMALRTGFNPKYVFVNFDDAAGFPMEQYTCIWELFAVVVIGYGFVSLFRRTVARNGFTSGNLSETQPLASGRILLMALVAVAGFFWFAASPTTHWWFFPLMAVAIVWCDALAARHAIPLAQAQATTHSAEIVSDANTPVIGDMPLFASVTLVAAFAGFAAFLWYAAVATEPWYFLPLLALAAVCFELGLPLGSRHFRAAILGFAIATMVLAIPAARNDLNCRFTNIDLLAQRVSVLAAPDDFIVVNPWYCGITFNRYYKGATPWNTLPPLDDHATHRFDLVREQMQKQAALQPVFDRMAAALRAGHSVWIVSKAGFAPKSGKAAEWPPPRPKFPGWADRPYSQTWAIGVWTEQCEQFLAAHSRDFRLVYSTTNQNVSSAENLQLSVAQGWEDTTNDLISSDPSHVR